MPWLKLQITLEEGQTEVIKELQEKLLQNQFSTEDISDFSQFLSEFIEYPIYYALPQNKDGERLEIINLDFIDSTPQKIIEKISQLQDPSIEGILSKNKKMIQSILTRDSFAWDVDDALTFSTVNNKINPESLLTVARRYYMLDTMKNNTISDIYTKIKNFPKDKRAFAVAVMVRQNHYVTKRCFSSLEPALKTSGRARSKVMDFIKEEKGHDVILQKSLTSMGFKESEVPVSMNTQCLMDMLYFAAKRNFLAFAIVIDFFERSNYSETDPLAQLLIDSGFTHSAKFINKHMEINDSGNHDLMSFELLKTVGLCSPEYAKEALIIAELTTLFMNNVVQETFKAHIEKL